LTEAHQEGGSAQDLSGKTIVPWTFDVKFPHGTQLTFGLLTFAAGEDGDLKMLPPGPAPEHLALASSSASDGSCSGSDSCEGIYIHTAKIVRGISVVTSILRPLIYIHLTTTLRSGPAPVGSVWKAVALSAWWPRMVINRTTALADIPPSGDQRRLMLGCRAAAWSGT
jgi:hypothetical protein